MIRHRILASLLPPRRPRVSTRKVKSPVSRYNERFDDGRPETSRPVTGLEITVLVPAVEQRPLPTPSRDDRPTHRSSRSRRE
jgi:hypothetical protein